MNPRIGRSSGYACVCVRVGVCVQVGVGVSGCMCTGGCGCECGDILCIMIHTV